MSTLQHFASQCSAASLVSPEKTCAWLTTMAVDGAPPHTPLGYSPPIEAWATRPDAL